MKKKSRVRINNKFKVFLKQYFCGLKIPKISHGEREILVEEINKIVKIIEKNPDINYNDLWDKIHEL